MPQLLVLQTGDQHFSNKADKLAESIVTNHAVLDKAEIELPDVILMTGDLVDEHDGPIRIDSESARAAIQYVKRAASIAPVLIIRGTRSHDRETPYLFDQLQTIHPVRVCSRIEMVALLPDNSFINMGDEAPYMMEDYKAVFTVFPSPDKANLIATFGGASITASTLNAKEVLNDTLAYVGSVNAEIPPNVPRIFVAHGMITGAKFSSGTVATGEDFEYSLADLALTQTDLKAFGHVHKFQTFPGNVFYSGSAGRLNMGETEEKGFLMHEMEGRALIQTRFIETPARRFVLYDVPWGDGGIDYILARANECESECNGADVRFRYAIPEEFRHMINREDLVKRFTDAGARLIKIEPTLIPKIRQRAAGISQMTSMANKVRKWAETVGIELPDRVTAIALTIESRDAEELIDDAKNAVKDGYSIETKEPVPNLVVEVQQDINTEEPNIEVIPMPTKEPVAADQYSDFDQLGLFG